MTRHGEVVSHDVGAVGVQADNDIILRAPGVEALRPGADVDAALYLVVLPSDDGGQLAAGSPDVPGRGPVD